MPLICHSRRVACATVVVRAGGAAGADVRVAARGRGVAVRSALHPPPAFSRAAGVSARASRHRDAAPRHARRARARGSAVLGAARCAARDGRFLCGLRHVGGRARLGAGGFVLAQGRQHGARHDSTHDAGGPYERWSVSLGETAGGAGDRRHRREKSRAGWPSWRPRCGRPRRPRTPAACWPRCARWRCRSPWPACARAAWHRSASWSRVCCWPRPSWIDARHGGRAGRQRGVPVAQDPRRARRHVRRTPRAHARRALPRAVHATGGGNLLAAALDAGFGSYSQFHRIIHPAVRLAPARLPGRRAPAPARCWWRATSTSPMSGRCWRCPRACDSSRRCRLPQAAAITRCEDRGAAVREGRRRART